MAREAWISFLDRHRLMSWWACSHTVYSDELLGEVMLHMTDCGCEFRPSA